MNLLTLREMELFRMALFYAKKYDECVPDVGIGPSVEGIAKKVASHLSFAINEDDVAECCENVVGSGA